MVKPEQRLGEYILIDRVASGAFGEVWRARHHAWSDQVVAVKIPTEPDYVRNLQTEGSAIRGLAHTNIVKAIAFDPFADPAYLVMEYVPGASLRVLIQRGPMQVQHAVAVMKQVLGALHHAHKNGVIHRDIKPENILVHKRVKEVGFAPGTVKLTDFGLGRTFVQTVDSIVLSGEDRQTREIIGSTQYMAPEQLEGEDLDGRADLYACGVVLFEMLTGKRPIGTEVPSELNPAVPSHLDEVFRRACARKERRFDSAEQFFEALSSQTTGTREAARQVPAQPASRHIHWRTAVASAVAAVVVMGVVLTIATKSKPRAPITSAGQAPPMVTVPVKQSPAPVIVAQPILAPKASPVTPTVGNAPPAIVIPRANANPPTANSAAAKSDAFTNTLGMNFVRIRPGTFLMGSPATEDGRHDDETVHHVKITKSFLMATTTVTQAQWKAVMGNNPSYFQRYNGFQSGNRPVENISWNDAVTFCEKLGATEAKHYRLPTEAEWEYACRAGTQTPFNFGDASLDDFAWSLANSGHQTHDVATKKPNVWGLYDMHGNVWQWCSDAYAPYAGDGVDPDGGKDTSTRVLRGGSWEYGPNYCRDACRDFVSPGDRSIYCGFRVCLGEP